MRRVVFVTRFGSVLVRLLLDELVFVQSQLSSYVSHRDDSGEKDAGQP